MEKTIQELSDEILQLLKGKTVAEVITILRCVRDKVQQQTKV